MSFDAFKIFRIEKWTEFCMLKYHSWFDTLLRYIIYAYRHFFLLFGSEILEKERPNFDNPSFAPPHDEIPFPVLR